MDKSQSQVAFILALLFLAIAPLGGGCGESDATNSDTGDGTLENPSASDDTQTLIDSETASEASDTETATDPSADTETATDPSAETWIDTAHGFEWENPSRKEAQALFPGAKGYCDKLVLASKDDWRVPTVDEARTILDGVSTTVEGGLCPVSEECFNWMTCATGPKNVDACEGCSDVSKKHLTVEDCTRNTEAAECYWLTALQGPCGSYWTTTKTGVPTGRYSIRYSTGSINAGVESASPQYVRCVRAI